MSGIEKSSCGSSHAPPPPSRLDSKSPSLKKGKGFIATLRRKFVARSGNADDDCRHGRVAGEDVVSGAAAATLCSSWRAARPRQVDQPLRPAYSDECLSCCTGSRCRRARLHRGGGAGNAGCAPSMVAEQHHELVQRHVTSASSKPPSSSAARPSGVKKSSGGSGTICRHCIVRDPDRSPSEIEPEPSEVEKARRGAAAAAEGLLPAETAYGASAYGHASAPVAFEGAGGASGGEISPSGDSELSAALHVCELHELTCEPMTLPPSQPFYDQVKEHGATIGKGWSLSRELFRVSNYGWYWGPISRVEAEEKLANQPDGAFLVRDSSDDRHLLSLSFRSYARTLHTRIEHCNGVFSFYAQPEAEGYSSIVDLIEHSMTDSQSGVFCYSRARVAGSPSFPVRLARPVSRFAQVRTLQYLCRFVIRQYTRVDHLQQLPLPHSIRGWLEEGQY